MGRFVLETPLNAAGVTCAGVIGGRVSTILQNFGVRASCARTCGYTLSYVQTLGTGIK